MITAHEAHMHAASCGILKPHSFAFPIGTDPELNPASVRLAHPVRNPEDCSEILPEGHTVTAEGLAHIAATYGLDYVVADAVPTSALPMPCIHIDDGTETDSWMGDVNGCALPRRRVVSVTGKPTESEPATKALQVLNQAPIGSIYRIGYLMRDTDNRARSWTYVKVNGTHWVEH